MPYVMVQCKTGKWSKCRGNILSFLIWFEYFVSLMNGWSVDPYMSTIYLYYSIWYFPLKSSARQMKIRHNVAFQSTKQLGWLWIQNKTVGLRMSRPVAPWLYIHKLFLALNDLDLQNSGVTGLAFHHHSFKT